MQTRIHRRFVFTPAGEQALPLQVESVGFNPGQEEIVRPSGYPLYHWIQTVEGEGLLTVGQSDYLLPPNSGMLLFPDEAHLYRAESSTWNTLYLTFGGPAAAEIVQAFGIRESAFFSWEPNAGLPDLLWAMLERLEAGEDAFGLDASSDTYRFVGLLSKFGALHHNKAITRNLEKLQPLLKWMDDHLANPEVGLADFGAVLGVSGRHLNSLFRETFGIAPYAYFLQVRLRKAKELLAASRGSTVSEIAAATGFRDPSHFVATFRKAAGMTPDQFRKLH
ncbi:transcriptional regulator [Paenibacillus yonginensis]|uniref:Transcriptional regulator n=1 Tax=Paenibacillus yonginensis TaxID=1462996 RepID=A0A1B1N1A3_9BACL|nr:AraC family transcriptional regulator [Paenibacillus yonginensis]ANS75217.1 transcriptional regulator [Paenibacillus yonginensis]